MSDGSTIGEWVLKKRYEDLNVNFRTIWDLYLKFYTVFLTFDLAALGWVYGHPGDIPSKLPIALAFVFQNVFVAITSGWMALHSRTTAARLLRVITGLGSVAVQRGQNDPPSESIDTIDLPLAIATWGGWANSTGVALLTVIWVVWWGPWR